MFFISSQIMLFVERKKVGIVGAGPGGLSCAMLLASRGIDVVIFEKEDRPGGRNSGIYKNGYVFDVGPTFLMMKFILDEIFQKSGKRIEDYLSFVKLDPMYSINFDNIQFFPSSDRKKMENELERVFPGNLKNLDRFYEVEKKRYEKLAPCLQKDYSHFSEFLSKRFLVAMPYILTRKSLFGILGDYFHDEKLRLCFTFQSKYLGMSPWECPGAFTIIPFVEHKYGIYHVIGGLHKISEAMAKAACELGCKIHYKKEIKEVVVENNKAVGLISEDGEFQGFDCVVINADFGYAMSNLFKRGLLKKYTPEKIKEKKYSCSTFMLYLGINKIYNISHHNIYFAKDYRQNIEDIFKNKTLSEDMSFYIQNASITDPTLAPKGKSTIYVLVPVPNNTSKINWDKERDKFAEKVIAKIEERTPMKDIRNHIEEKILMTPHDWEKNKNIFFGATFNLSHSLDQMLYFRPHNKFEEFDSCYIVGGGTHPGSGLPTIYESGKITANLILKKFGMKSIDSGKLS